MKRKNMGIAFLLTAAMLSAGGFALWISGWNITGNMAISGGTQPDVQESAITFTGATGDTDTVNATYDNLDGVQNFTFSCSDTNVISTAGNCQYQGYGPGKDLQAIYISQDGSTWFDCADLPNFQIQSGANTFYFKASIHANSCPLGGYATISGALA